MKYIIIATVLAFSSIAHATPTEGQLEMLQRMLEQMEKNNADLQEIVDTLNSKTVEE